MMLVEPPLDVERQRKAREYNSLSRWLSLIKLVVVGVLSMALVFRVVSSCLSQFLVFDQPWASSLYFVILIVGLGMITLPLTYCRGFVLPHRYGLSNQKVRQWLTDLAKAAALGIILGLVAVIFVYLLLEYSPNFWWLWASILLWLLGLLLARSTPTVFLPLFFKLEPLADADLKQRLLNLAEMAGASIRGVFTMDLSSKSTSANAMLAGIGKTRRIILSDNLLQRYTPEEIEVIMAHELGYHIHRDMPKLLAVQGGILLVAFYLADLSLRNGAILLGFRGIADVTALPLLALVLAAFSLVISPLVNVYSRRLESLADETALGLTANPKAFITVMSKLIKQNLGVAKPSRLVEILFYDHPSYVRRVDLARRYAKYSLQEVHH